MSGPVDVHVVGYFGFTLMFWLAWQRRPFVLGGTLTRFNGPFSGAVPFL
jgi:hypothetical protein